MSLSKVDVIHNIADWLYQPQFYAADESIPMHHDVYTCQIGKSASIELSVYKASAALYYSPDCCNEWQVAIQLIRLQNRKKSQWDLVESETIRIYTVYDMIEQWNIYINSQYPRLIDG